MAEGKALTGDLDNALNLIDKQIAQIERPGWEERMSCAEILRLNCWALSLKGDLAGAERNFLASLDWANARTRTSYSPRSTVGSPKVSMRRI